ncbi:transposase family protein [Streptomyces sp. NPDC093586]|uniref:transposase family protein n=1 Tax=Streptomyces sp. NPDC093586 TaxID=3366042 RepID=UPI003825B6B9
MLDRLPDPRRVWCRRHRLGSLLALCLLAVLGGATSLAGIARFATDAPADVRKRTGLMASRCVVQGISAVECAGPAPSDAPSAFPG